MADVPLLCGSWPTLSQLRSSQFDHLGQFADYCDHIFGKSEKALEQLAQDVRAPGGVEWEGEAGSRAIAQAGVDVIKARSFLWSLPDAADIARQGQNMLEAGKRAALDVVGDAQRNGFRVDEDYSVSDTREASTEAQYEKRLEEAEAHSNFIRHRVGMLVGNDQSLNTKLKEATAGWGRLSFAESPGETNDKIVGDDDRRQVQPVDRTWKQDPIQEPYPGPSVDDIRRVLDKLPQGNQPWVREVRSPEDLQSLWNWMTQNGVDNPNRYSDPAKGKWKDLPDGAGVGRREAAGSTKQPALDVRLPGQDGYVKVHVNPRGEAPDIPAPASPGSAPVISPPPSLPTVLDHPPVAPQPVQPAHPAPTAIPPTVLDHPPLPPWLQDPSPPGFHITPNEPPPIAPFDTPDAPPIAASPGVPGPPVTLHMPDLHAPDVQLSPEQQRSLETNLGVGGILGLLLIGGLLVVA